jgi:hypothetical protein
MKTFYVRLGLGVGRGVGVAVAVGRGAGEMLGCGAGFLGPEPAGPVTPEVEPSCETPRPGEVG